LQIPAGWWPVGDLCYTAYEKVSMNTPETNSRLELLYKLARELAASLDLTTTLDKVLNLALAHVGAEGGALLALDERMQPAGAAVIYQNQVTRNSPDRLKAILEHGLAGWVARTKEKVVVPDTSQDSRWLLLPGISGNPQQAKSALCMPLMASGKLVGVLTIMHPAPGFFHDDHLDLLSAVADQAGMAVHNAFLYESLQAATQRYRELFQHNLNPILLTSQHGEILEANLAACSLSGYTHEELQNQTMAGLFPQASGWVAEITDRASTSETVEREMEFRHKNGKLVPVEVHAHAGFTAGEPTVHWTLRDLTEHLELERMRDEMVAMMFHDLRSPLSNIVSSLAIMDTFQEVNDQQDLVTVVNIANRSADRLQRILDSMLDMYRLERDQPLANVEAIEPGKLLQDAADVLRSTLSSRSQQLDLDLPDNFPLVQADADMIRRVLINLLENASKFTPVGGDIRLESHTGEGRIYFSVIDNGPGIPQEIQDKIFEKFTRVSGENISRGLGLGLAFCRLAVRAHGGDIRVASMTGKGSHFSFWIPVSPEDNSQ
jgi:PAS domain S-box-containing protein